MSDLDARIRLRLISNGGWGDAARQANERADALSAVLNWVRDAEEFGDEPDYSDARDIIARALGVIDEPD